jgi:hypothetical protein
MCLLSRKDCQQLGFYSSLVFITRFVGVAVSVPLLGATVSVPVLGMTVNVQVLGVISIQLKLF